LLPFASEAFVFQFSTQKYKYEIYRTMTLQTRPLALREKCTMMMFESRMFRKIFEPKWSKAIGQQRTMHNALNDLYLSPSIARIQIQKHEMGWAYGKIWAEERCTQGFGGAT
jgi:hypothetical protein